MDEKTEKPGYVIQFSRQHAGLGEVITINTQLPLGASQESISEELVKLGRALDNRIRDINKDVLARTGKNLEDMKLVIPGLVGMTEGE